MILVTGGYGCIGAELVKWLLQHSTEEILLASRTVNDARTQRAFHGVDIQRLTCISLDVSDRQQVDRLFGMHDITRVAHLAALQTPECNAYPDRGLQINLAGTQHLLEAIKSSGKAVERFVFASTIGVYGPRASYPQERVPMLAEPQPVNLYGTWKLASEHLCRLFHTDTGTPTICLRPGVLYGPGRDIGLTSTPTTAMKCVALGLPYQIPFANRQDYLYAPDVGAAFAQSLLEPFEGYGVYTLPAHTVEMPALVDALRQAAVTSGLGDSFAITIGNDAVPFICDLEYEAYLQKFPQTPHSTLAEGVRESLRTFQQQVQRGWLTSESVS